MTTTTYINVTTDDALEDGDAVQRIEDRFKAYIARDTDYDIDYLTTGMDGDLDVSTGGLTFWANTKYSLDGSRKVARAMSGAYPNTDVEWTNEWDDDEPGRERVTFRNGKTVTMRETALVPVNLDALVRDLEAAMKRRGHERNTSPAVREAAAALIAAYRA